MEDVTKNSGFNVRLGAGKEWRRGYGRLQGVYGGEALLSVRSNKTTNEYGNDIEDEFPTGGSRTTETKSGLNFGIGVRGFLGVEYFIAPKMSLGAEYGYALTFNTQANGESTDETYDGTNDDTVTTETGGGSSFGFDTDASGFNIKFNFHF